MPPPQPYPGMYYQPMAPEHLLSHRNLFFANAAGLFLIWLGLLIHLINPRDVTLQAGGWFFVVTGGLLSALASMAGALWSKKTTDLQNIGLFIWAGCVAILTGLALLGAGL